MSRRSIRARPAEGHATVPPIGRDADVLAAHLEDAAHFPGGFASGLASPSTEGEVAALVRAAMTVLPIGAQSSLTGGATPRGEVLLSTARLNRIIAIGDDSVRAQAGVTLVELDAALARAGKRYPPVPTFTGAFAVKFMLRAALISPARVGLAPSDRRSCTTVRALATP